MSVMLTKNSKIKPAGKCIVHSAKKGLQVSALVIHQNKICLLSQSNKACIVHCALFTQQNKACR